MINERYLEYLALDSIMQGWMSSVEFNLNRPDVCETFWFADGTKAPILLNKLKARITELQKEFLSPYIIDSTSNED